MSDDSVPSEELICPKDKPVGDPKLILVANDAEKTQVPISLAAAKHSGFLADFINAETIQCEASGLALRVVVAYLEELQTKIVDNVELRTEIFDNNIKFTNDNQVCLDYYYLLKAPWVVKYMRPVFNENGELVAANPDPMGESYRELLLDVVELAEQWGIVSLFSVACRQVALLMRDKTPDQWNEILRPPEDRGSPA